MSDAWTCGNCGGTDFDGNDAPASARPEAEAWCTACGAEVEFDADGRPKA